MSTAGTRTAPEWITIGHGGPRVAPLGVGVWSWGERAFWGYGKDFGREDVAAAFRASVEAGVTLFDTAELYGGGESERLLGELARGSETPVVVATKFAPWPSRLSARTLRAALDGSLARLGRERVELYQIHWPYTLLSIESLMDALADAVTEGKVGAVGVSNYSARQMRRAHAALARRGVPLASNQVQYSLLYRQPEANGVLDTCRELGVTPIAYSPLAQGVLTGKYPPGAAPSGPRRFTRTFRPGNLRAAQGVVELLRGIGEDHGGKTPEQVALNWLIGRGALPIPGAKNARQATSNAGALGWTLHEAEMAALDRATARWRG